MPLTLLAKHPKIKHLLYKSGLINKYHCETEWPEDIIRRDASKRLPYKDNSVALIYSSHFLEHLMRGKALSVIEECYRCLSHNGILRIAVPDLLIHAKQYIEATESMLAQGKEYTNEHNERLMKTVSGGYWRKVRSGHHYMYDFPTLFLMLQKIGFRKIQRCGYRESQNDEMAGLDNYSTATLFVEAVK